MTTRIVYLVTPAGERADQAVEALTFRGDGKLALEYLTRRYRRFVLHDGNGVQVYASDPRDETGAFIPYEQLKRECDEEKRCVDPINERGARIHTLGVNGVPRDMAMKIAHEEGL